MSAGPNWYDVLDVEPTATTDQIRDAWRSAIAELTPADRRFRLYNEAAEVLLDDERRAAYDASLAPDPVPDAEPSRGPEAPVSEVPQQVLASQPPCDYLARVFAFGLDALVGLAGAVLTSVGLLFLSLEPAVAAPLMLVGVAVTLLTWLYNIAFLQGTTGQTWGKATLGIRVINRDGRAPGPMMSVVRQVAHGVDGLVLGLGYLLPLFDRDGQTIADKIVSTRVVDAPSTQPKRVATSYLVVLAFAAAAMVGALLLPLTLLSTEREVSDQTAAARSAAERAVVPVLSYDYQDLEGSREAAQEFLTPGYGEEYDKLYDGLVQGNAGSTETVVEAEFVASAVVRGGEDRAEILVFVDQSTTNAQNKQPVVYRNQVRMRMENVEGRWLVDCMITQPGGECAS